MIDGDNPETGTAREDGPLSTQDAADRLVGMLDDENDPEQAKAEPDNKTVAEPEKAEPEDRDEDDWDQDPQAGDEAAPDAEEAACEDEDQPSEQGRFVGDDAKVKLSDGRVVTVAELRSGSLMQADYSRKTAKLADDARQLETRAAELSQTEQQVIAQRELALAILQENAPAEPELSELRDDPFGYMERKAAFDAHQKKVSDLQAQKAQHEELQAQKSAAAYQERIKTEVGAFLEKAPELRNPEKFKRFFGELTGTFEKAYGIKPEEITQVGDHRWIFAMRDALRYQRMQANKAKSEQKVQGKPPAVMKPGRRVSPEAIAARDHEAKRQRLHKSGDIRDAASIIADML